MNLINNNNNLNVYSLKSSVETIIENKKGYITFTVTEWGVTNDSNNKLIQTRRKIINLFKEDSFLRQLEILGINILNLYSKVKQLPSTNSLKRFFEKKLKVCKNGTLNFPLCKLIQNVLRQQSLILKRELSIELKKTSKEKHVETIYDKILKSHNSFFADVSLKDYLIYYQGKYLKVAGINILLDIILTERSPCYICNELKDLTEAVEQLLKANFKGKIGFLVRSGKITHHYYKASHITPVLIEINDKFNICILDSVGSDQSGGVSGIGSTQYKISQKESIKGLMFSQNIYNAIQAVRYEIPEFEPKIYVSTIRRQHDKNNCVVFSLHDVKIFFKEGNYFETLELTGELEPDELDENLYRIHNLRPSHMALTQSLTFINTYLEKNLKYYSEIFKKELEALRISVKKSKRKTERGQKVNMKANDRYIKYLAIINFYLYALDFKKFKTICLKYNFDHMKNEIKL